MFEIWENGPPPRRLGEAGSFRAAVDRLDTECQHRHRRAAEGETARRYVFEIREGAEIAARMVWEPDTTRPYESAVADLRGFEEMP